MKAENEAQCTEHKTAGMANAVNQVHGLVRSSTDPGRVGLYKDRYDHRTPSNPIPQETAAVRLNGGRFDRKPRQATQVRGWVRPLAEYQNPTHGHIMPWMWSRLNGLSPSPFLQFTAMLFLFWVVPRTLFRLRGPKESVPAWISGTMHGFTNPE